MMYGLGLGFPIAGFFMMAVVGLVIWLIVSAVRPARATGTAPSSRAMEVLADRYARGEIDAETYRSTKTTIEGGH
jgi:putative membrane protein